MVIRVRSSQLDEHIFADVFLAALGAYCDFVNDARPGGRFGPGMKIAD